MPYIPYDFVARAIQGEMDGYGQLDYAKVGRQMAPGARYCVDHALAYLGCQLPDLSIG